jgi:hypothetical protein
MQLADREEFRVQLEKLCAAFNVPCTEAREEAYFRAFSRLSLIAFARLVDAALDENGPQKLPTVHDLWELYKHTKGAKSQAPPADDPDHLAYLANRLLWLHVSHRGGLGSTGTFVPAYGMVDAQASPELTRCLAFKRELVKEFCRYVTERDDMATPAAFIRWWLAGLAKISEVLPRTRRDLEQLAGEPESQIPFPTYMARELDTPPSRLSQPGVNHAQA